MLNHDSKEKQTGRCEMDDVDAEILLEYVYGCETGKVNADNVEKVLSMADKYELMDLRAVAEPTLAKTIMLDNALQLLAMARQRNLGTLKEVVLRFIRKNTEAVLSQSLAI